MKAKQALIRSGYFLEHRIEATLSRNRYVPDASTMIPDPLTGKSRELDLYALKLQFMRQRTHDVLLSVIIAEYRPALYYEPLFSPYRRVRSLHGRSAPAAFCYGVGVLTKRLAWLSLRPSGL
jgi:hypothetical protein